MAERCCPPAPEELSDMVGCPHAFHCRSKPPLMPVPRARRHHRQVMMDKLGDPRGEAEFMEKMFDKDAKNYHVWSYR